MVCLNRLFAHLSEVGVAIIAILHAWFFILEFFFWTEPLGQKIFQINKSFALQSRALAANQGIYNLFLSVGLIWGLVASNPLQSFQLKFFFLACIVIAGVYAGISVNRRIFFVQGLPAITIIIFLLLS